MTLIGLTGGIGSGKSTVADLFKLLGIPVYESDGRAKDLMVTDDEVREKIIALLGSHAYVDNQLNRSWIASQVFPDRLKLDMLNKIVHPAVYKDLIAWSEEKAQIAAPYLIQESAILFEENLTDRFKAVILVVANPEDRIKRVMERDNKSREEILKRMDNQWPDENKIPLADYVIYNDAGRSLINQVMDIDRMIRAGLTNG